MLNHIELLALSMFIGYILWDKWAFIKARLNRLAIYWESKAPNWALYFTSQLATFRNECREADTVVLAEINHLKGQNQELRQLLQNLQQLPIATSNEQQSQEASIYLQSLAGLAKGMQSILDRQEKIEGLLIQAVGQLKALTQ